VTELSVSELPEPDDRPGERQALEEYLDYFRVVLRRKATGLNDAQTNARPCPPSTLSLVGLVRHMTEVERYWFRAVLDNQLQRGPYSSVDQPNEDIVPSSSASIGDALAAFDAEVAAVREIAGRYELDTITTPRKRGRSFNLRWIYVHMIEEYARHCGHADLLREAIDGLTGD